MRNIWTLRNNLICRIPRFCGITWFCRMTQFCGILRFCGILNSILRNNLIFGKTRFSGIQGFCGRPDLTEYRPISSSSSFACGHVQYITEIGGGQERTKTPEISVAAMCTSVKFLRRMVNKIERVTSSSSGFTCLIQKLGGRGGRHHILLLCYISYIADYCNTPRAVFTVNF